MVENWKLYVHIVVLICVDHSWTRKKIERNYLFWEISIVQLTINNIYTILFMILLILKIRQIYYKIKWLRMLFLYIWFPSNWIILPFKTSLNFTFKFLWKSETLTIIDGNKNSVTSGSSEFRGLKRTWGPRNLLYLLSNLHFK